MVVVEYQIPMPLTVEEYKVAQLYMVAKFSRQRTTKGEGIEILKNEPYEDENGKGQYTHKVIHLGSHLPSWVKAVIPGSMTQVEEKSWNAYPYVKTLYTCPFFGERFSIITETRYFADSGSQTNALKLSETALSQRTVDLIDIAANPVDPKYYKKEEDPKLYSSTKTSRGPLSKDWIKTTTPIMTEYKLATVEFKVWGLQTKAEAWLQKAMVRDVLLLGHKQAFCWIDEWYGLTMDDIRVIEEETKIMLDKVRNGTLTPEEVHKTQIVDTSPKGTVDNTSTPKGTVDNTSTPQGKEEEEKKVLTQEEEQMTEEQLD